MDLALPTMFWRGDVGAPRFLINLLWQRRVVSVRAGAVVILSQLINLLTLSLCNQRDFARNRHDQMPLQQNIFEVMDKLREILPQRKFDEPL